MKLMGFEAGNTLFKFYEKRAFCEELASGRIYMKANGYFRQLEDTYRGDPADSRLKVEKKGKTLCVHSRGQGSLYAVRGAV